LTSPRCAVSKVAFHFLERRIVPSSKEGIRIHHYSGSSRTNHRWATAPTKAGSWPFLHFVCKTDEESELL
jgi:hypothetical protein